MLSIQLHTWMNMGKTQIIKEASFKKCPTGYKLILEKASVIFNTLYERETPDLEMARKWLTSVYEQMLSIEQSR